MGYELRPIHPVQVVLVERDLEDLRLDQDLLRLPIDLGHHPLHAEHEVGQILDDEHAAVGKHGDLSVAGLVLG